MFTVRARISNAESLRYVLDRVAVEVKRLHADLPDTLKTTRRKLDLAERRVANFIAFIGDGKGTRALGQALETSETELEQLRGELAALEGTARATFAPPPIEWIAERMRPLGELLGRQTARSALVLRRILGPVRLRPVRPQVGRPYYQAETALEVLDLLDVASREAGTSEGGSNWYRKWTRSLPIRTAARVAVAFPLLVVREPFPYQALAVRVRELANLGMSTHAIARALGVDWKTVRKALERFT